MLKLPQIPPTDLARIAPLTDDEKRTKLSQIKTGINVPYNYKPARECYHDIFNVQAGFDFGKQPPTPWQIIDRRIRSLSRNVKDDAEYEQNCMIAKCLHDYASSVKLVGRTQDFPAFHMGAVAAIKLWLSMTVVVDGKAYAMFIDPRRQNGLNEAGRRFAFSMMHEAIRVADEDFSSIGLLVLRFGSRKGGRTINVYNAEGVALYGMEELQAMVSRTYEIWREIHEGRDRDSRGRATGTGPLI